jgi:hypothetical protein
MNSHRCTHRVASHSMGTSLGTSFGLALLLGLAACGGGGGHHDSGASATLLFTGGGSASIGAGAQPSAVVTADFNADGALDVAVADRVAGTIHVMLGTGAGTLGASSSVALGAGAQPAGLVAADFDFDGKIDLAACDAAGGGVTILHGAGNGSFAIAATIALGAGVNASALVAADLNHDGRLDLAVCNVTTGSVAVALGGAGGTFGPATPFVVAAGFDGTAMAAADVNGDGDLDLAISSGANGSVAIMLGSGAGTLGAPTFVAIAAGATLSDVALEDCDRNGRIDLLVTNRTSGEVSIALGNGDGTFSTAIDFAAGAQASAIVTGDFDADGRIDVAATLGTSGGVAVLLGHGDGTLGASTTIATGGAAAAAIALGDCNRDGSLDLVVADGSSAQVQVLIGQGHALLSTSFSTSATVGVGAGFDPSSVVPADVNGDGKLDLVIANEGHDSVSVALGAGNGSFSAAIETSLGVTLSPSAVVCADFNADGKLDIAVANSAGNNALVLTGSGAGAFALSATISVGLGAQPSSIVAADFNHDGKMDVAIGNQLLGTVSLALGNGDGTFALPTSLPVALGFSISGMVAADLNNDGSLDLALTSATTGSFAVKLGHGDGTFDAAVSTTTDAGTSLSGLVAIDCNRDGRLDLVVANRTTGDVSVMLGNGDGTFGVKTDFAAGADLSAIVAADFDRDGRLDLAVTLEATGRVHLLRGNGNGTFAAALDFTAGGTAAVGLATGDCNRDGKLDIVAVEQASGSAQVLLATGS